jgi:hypothetical protein
MVEDWSLSFHVVVGQAHHTCWSMLFQSSGTELVDFDSILASSDAVLSQEEKRSCVA